MKSAIASILSTPSSLALLGLALTSTTGCGTLSAIGNPGAMWAINDPAPLVVVVRRADAAQLTTVEVNRLLTSTPTGKDTDWTLNVSPDPKIAAADMKALTQDPDYAKSRARVVAAEVWIRTLPSVQATSGEHPNLLAAIDQGLADSYAAIIAKQAEIASLNVQIETEKTAAGAKDVSPGDKKTHEDAAKDLAKQEADDEKQVEPLQKTFLGQVKDAAAKVSPDDQKRFAPAVSSLLQALADADIANSAAAIKYPLVIKGITDAIKSVVPTIAGDVVEEQTGVRPSLANMKVKIDLHGSDVTVGVDGLGDLGKLNVADVASETVTRSVKWTGHALTLLGTVNSTKNTINFEREVLSQMQSAWAGPASSTVVVFKMPEANSPEVMGATASVNVSLAGMAHAKAAASASAAAAASAKTAQAKAGPANGKKGAPAKAGAKKAPPAKKDDKKSKAG